MHLLQPLPISLSYDRSIGYKLQLTPNNHWTFIPVLQSLPGKLQVKYKDAWDGLFLSISQGEILVMETLKKGTWLIDGPLHKQPLVLHNMYGKMF